MGKYNAIDLSAVTGLDNVVAVLQDFEPPIQDYRVDWDESINGYVGTVSGQGVVGVYGRQSDEYSQTKVAALKGAALRWVGALMSAPRKEAKAADSDENGADSGTATGSGSTGEWTASKLNKMSADEVKDLASTYYGWREAEEGSTKREASEWILDHQGEPES